MPNTLQSYHTHKIKLVFHGFDLKVVESNKAIELNKYADSLFTSFTIDSPEFEDKKGIFIFTVDGTVVYVGITNDSLKTNEIDEKQKEEKEITKDSLEYYEKNYLFYDKIFVYPYSIPMDDSSSENEEKEISIGKKKYLEKYKDAIIQGRKRHYGEDYED